jgi:flagellar M-ring protein FliF
MGNIRRLSAAVVLNHRKDVDKTGKPITKPIPDAEMKQINELVREAMGFTRERGDSLSVANAPFTAIDKSDSELPIWKDPENVSFLKDILKYLLIAGIVAFLYLKVIQPTLKTMFPPPESDKTKAGEAESGGIFGSTGTVGSQEEGEEGATVHIDHFAVKVQKARDLAATDPKAIANMIKDWMGANGN